MFDCELRHDYRSAARTGSAKPLPNLLISSSFVSRKPDQVLREHARHDQPHLLRHLVELAGWRVCPKW